ncbi:IS110 family transposase [Nocardiopsis sp. NPDC055879]
MTVVGIDAHKDWHTLVAVDDVGKRLAELTVPARARGHQKILTWLTQFADVQVAVEDCRHLTRRLEADLLDAGHKVVRVHTELNRRGHRVARCTVQRLMKRSGPRGIARVGSEGLRPHGAQHGPVEGPSRRGPAPEGQ